MHDNPIVHWLELQVTRDLYEKRPDLVLAMEMFEADDQMVMDEYLKGWIEEKHLLKEAKLWDNYQTDYKPLIDFARKQHLHVVASNIPRRYANMVYRYGIEILDSLPAESRRWIAPLPIEIDLGLPGYQNMISETGHTGSTRPQTLAQSQAVKDATMAYFILKNRKGTVIHFNGAYHSQNEEGIVWYLRKAEPELRIVTIHSVEQEKIDSLDELSISAADFIICVPEDMTGSY